LRLDVPANSARISGQQRANTFVLLRFVVSQMEVVDFLIILFQ
jgi:hypothetical protein